jgi:hypothetical protein
MSLIALACGLALSSLAAGQEGQPAAAPDAFSPFQSDWQKASSAHPFLADPDPVGERPLSPVDRLESLTGERGERSESPEKREPIETDRDSFTPATLIAPKGRLILESALTYLDYRGSKPTYSFPETILRYGLTERIELRLGWNADIGSKGSDVSGGSGENDPFTDTGKVDREYSISYGAKFRITDQSSWVPRSVVIIQGFTPTGGSAGTSTATRLAATVAGGWVFPNRWQLDTAMRYGLDSENGNHFSAWLPSAVLRIPLGEKLAVHAEYFGEFTAGKEHNRTLNYFSPGMRYLVTPDLEIGARVGWGLNEQSARFFMNAGFGWQF